MKKSLALIATIALFAPLAAHAEPVGADLLPVQVAYADLASGQTDVALAKLQQHDGLAANDPSRLINLGAAYARLGQTERAAQAYRAAMRSDIQYEVQLANGRYMDSREAASAGLKRLTSQIAAR